MTPNLEKNWEDLQFRNQKLFSGSALALHMTLADCFLLQVFVFLKGSLPDRGIHQGDAWEEGQWLMSVFGRASVSLQQPYTFLRLLLLRRTFVYQVLRCCGLLKNSFCFFLVALGHSPSPLHIGPASSFTGVSPRA